MKKIGVLLLIALLLVSPAAYAFSFSDIFEFIGDIFGSDNKITGNAMRGGGAPGGIPEGMCSTARCGGRFDPACCSGYTCTKGSCVANAVCGNGNTEGSEECDDGWDNTDTPCSADYDSSCTYCDTSCESNTVDGASCGDENCNAGIETCSSCDADCGECVTFDAAPTVSLSISDFAAGSSSPSLTITNGIKCSYSIFEFSTAEASTRRGASTRTLEIFVNEPMDCDNSQTTLSSKLEVLPSGNYDAKIEAKNNQGTTTESSTFEVTGGSITITTPKIGYTYSPTDSPNANVVVSGSVSSCTWNVNEGSSISFDCERELNNIDLSPYSSDGVNTLTIIADSQTAKRDYIYYETASLVGEIKVTESGARGGSRGYGILIGGESGVEDAPVTLALWAAKENLRTKGGMSKDNADTILATLTSDSELAKRIAAVQQTVGSIDFAVLPTTRITEIKTGKSYTSQIAVYNSRKAESIVSTETNPETHELIIRKGGDGDSPDRLTIELHSDPIIFELDLGDCKDVDMNSDEISDLIVCYEEETGDVTVNNLVTVDDSITDEYDEHTTVISPVTVTTTKIYELPFDEELIISELTKQYLPIVSIMGMIMVILSILSIRTLVVAQQKPKRRKRK